MQWNPDCEDDPCDCPGTVVEAPADDAIPATAEGRRAEVLNRHSENCAVCRNYIETGNPSDRPTPLER